MFNSVTRVVRVNDMSWLSTVRHMVYRNLTNGLIINRSSELYLGRVVPGKYYVWAKGNDGRYVKMRHLDGRVAMYSDSLEAMEASTQLYEVFKLEEERKLLMGILHELSLEIEAKRKELDEVKPACMRIETMPTQPEVVDIPNEAPCVADVTDVSEPVAVVEDVQVSDGKSVVSSVPSDLTPEEAKALGELPAHLHQGALSIIRPTLH